MNTFQAEVLSPKASLKQLPPGRRIVKIRAGSEGQSESLEVGSLLLWVGQAESLYVLFNLWPRMREVLTLIIRRGHSSDCPADIDLPCDCQFDDANNLCLALSTAGLLDEMPERLN